MKLEKHDLEFLHDNDLAILSRESEGRFPLSELQEAARSQEASEDLVAWLRDERAASQSAVGAPGPGSQLRSPRNAGNVTDGPRMGDLKNYEQGPEGADQTNQPPS